MPRAERVEGILISYPSAKCAEGWGSLSFLGKTKRGHPPFDTLRYQGAVSVREKVEYEVFEALNPFFEVVLRGLSGLVDGEHFFDTFAEDAIFESRYQFPGWPVRIQGRTNLMASLSGYGKTIKVHSGDALVVHRAVDSRVVILEYEVHGRILSSGAPYDNRLISVVTIEKRKIVYWIDYMDSLAAWTALNSH